MSIAARLRVITKALGMKNLPGTDIIGNLNGSGPITSVDGDTSPRDTATQELAVGTPYITDNTVGRAGFLPILVLDVIFGFCYDWSSSATLSSATLINRHWREPAQKALFRSIVIRRESGVAGLLSVISGSFGYSQSSPPPYYPSLPSSRSVLPSGWIKHLKLVSPGCGGYKKNGTYVKWFTGLPAQLTDFAAVLELTSLHLFFLPLPPYVFLPTIPIHLFASLKTLYLMGRHSSGYWSLGMDAVVQIKALTTLVISAWDVSELDTTKARLPAYHLHTLGLCNLKTTPIVTRWLFETFAKGSVSHLTYTGFDRLAWREVVSFIQSKDLHRLHTLRLGTGPFFVQGESYSLTNDVLPFCPRLKTLSLSDRYLKRKDLERLLVSTGLEQLDLVEPWHGPDFIKNMDRVLDTQRADVSLRRLVFFAPPDTSPLPSHTWDELKMICNRHGVDFEWVPERQWIYMPFTVSPSKEYSV